ncbi:MAG TPA: M23 family metallopeptidase [Peptostreptococcaceae bacterium]|nr:M23 family metallopeptidase [Peptostreptococcaceae bacterium]
MKNKKILERDGFYLALFLCVCLVAVGAVWVTKNSIDDLATNGFVNYSDGELAKGDDEVHLIKEKDKSVPTTTNSDQNLEKAKEQKAKESATVAKNIMPVQGEVTKEYAEKQPSYNSTLAQWEIHKAVDIQAKAGSTVKSIASGKVIDVSNNDKYGTSVKIESSNKTILVYSNLDKNSIVKVDQSVKAGDTIGKVGNTSTVESAEGAHLHLEAFKDGKSINPMNLMK